MINKKDIKVMAIAISFAIVITIPIFRWNIGEKTHYSILESLFEKDVKSVELVVGNIYNTIIDIAGIE